MTDEMYEPDGLHINELGLQFFVNHLQNLLEAKDSSDTSEQDDF